MRALSGCLACLVCASAQAQEVQLKFGFPAPPTSFVLTEVMGPWSKELESTTGGAVAVTTFPGGSVGNFNNIIDRTLNAVVDFSFGIFGPYSTQFPKTQVTTLPFETTDVESSAVVLWRLHAKGVTSSDYAAFHPIAFFNFPSAEVHSRKPVKKIDDMQGLKLSVSNRTMGQEMELLGAAPISLQPSDVYQSMQRGVIDGLLNSWTAVQTFKLYEVTSHHLEVPLGQSPAFVIFNKDAYAKLPAKVRQAVDKSSGETLSRRLGKATDENRASGRALVAGMKDHTIAGLDTAETERWRVRLKPVVDDWIKSTSDGARVLAAFREELAKVRTGK